MKMQAYDSSQGLSAGILLGQNRQRNPPNTFFPHEKHPTSSPLGVNQRWIGTAAPIPWSTEREMCEVTKCDSGLKEPGENQLSFWYNAYPLRFEEVAGILLAKGSQMCRKYGSSSFIKETFGFSKCLVRVWKGEASDIFHVQVKYRGGRCGNTRKQT